MTNELTEADRAELTAALKTWQEAGETNPMIPMDVDINGDGHADVAALDGNGNLIFVSGINLEDTVYESTGSGIETDREGTLDG